MMDHLTSSARPTRASSNRAKPKRATPNYGAAKTETTMDMKQQVKDLANRVENLTMAYQALWEFVSATHGWTEEHLAARIAEIDGRDGRVDGKRTIHATQCPCGAAIRSRSRSCEFCGAVANSSVIEQL